MVMIWAPKPLSPNSTNICEGVELYQASRPPRSQPYRDLNLAAYGIFLCVLSISIVILWKWRNKPRFLKVRPFYQNVLYMIGWILYQTPSVLAAAVAFPCVVFVLCWATTMSIIGTAVFFRAWVVTLESQYSILASKMENKMLVDTTGTSETSVKVNPSICYLAYASVKSGIVPAMKVMLGMASVEDFSIRDIVLIRTNVMFLLVAMQVPSVVFLIGLFLAAPQFWYCNDCDIFLELPIGVLIVLTFVVGFAFRAGLVAFRQLGWDSKGVSMELVSISPVAGTFAFVAWILAILDPNDIGHNREFNWMLINFFSSASFWWISFGRQIYAQWRDDRETATIVASDMRTTLETDPQLQKQFAEFAAKHYVSESLRFLEDVAAYKRYFYEKPDRWRVSKFKNLVEAYIVIGSDFEVNISHGMRTKILRAYAQPPGSPKELFAIFDHAASEVLHMVENGPWKEFMRSSRKHDSSHQAGRVLTSVDYASTY